ncbi:hypothetical protein FOZ62_010163, partial [Perkinsus olseni]
AGNAKRHYDRNNAPQGFFVGARVLLRLMKHQRPTKLSPMWEPNWFITQIVGSSDPIKVVRLFHLPSKRVKVLSVDHIKVDPLQPDNIQEIMQSFPEPLRDAREPNLASTHGSAAVSSDGLRQEQSHVRFEGLFGAGTAGVRPLQAQQLPVNSDGLIGGERMVYGSSGAQLPRWQGLDAFRPRPVEPAGPPQVAPAYVSIPNDRQDDIQRALSGPITVPTLPVMAPNVERAPPPVDPAAVSVPSGGTTDLRSASSQQHSQAADASVLLSTPQEESPATPSGPSLSLASPSVPSIPSVPSLLLTSPDLASRPSSPAPVPDNINSGHVSEATPFTSPNASMVDARSGTSSSSSSSSVATEQDAVSANSDFDSTTPNVSSDAGESLHGEELAVPEEEDPVLEQEEAPVREEEAD